MLLTNRMASIPSLKDHRYPLVTLAPPPSVTPSLRHFNMRVTERLHRYRSLKRQWNEVSTAVPNDSSLPSKPDTPLLFPDILPITHEQLIKDYINTTTMKEKNALESSPLNSQIQQDLIHLRRLIKARQQQRREKRSSRETILLDDQEKKHSRKMLSINKTNSLNRVKISGCQMRPSTFPESGSVSVNTHQSSSSCSNYPKQQNIPRIFNIIRTRVNHHSLPADSLIQGLPPPKKKSNTPPKTTSTSSGKQTTSYRLSIPPVIKKKQSNFIKPETSLPSIRQPLPPTEPTTTRGYTFAASTSSATPQSMKFNRKTSLLPILLTSSSCTGFQSRRSLSGKSRENKPDHSYNLLDYKHLVSHLPKPVVPIVPRYDQGDYGILFEQLNHMRDTMPNSNVYENYTRIC